MNVNDSIDCGELLNILSPKKCFIFDLDGTLVNLNADWQGVRDNLTDLAKIKYHEQISFFPFWKGLKQVEKKFGAKALKEFHQLMELNENNAVSTYAEINMQGKKLLQYIEMNLIRNSQQKKCLAVLSNNFKSTITLALQRFNMSNSFDLIIGRDMLKKTKPDPEGLESIFNNKKSIISKKDMIFFGDSTFDEEAARKFKIDFLYIDKINF